MINITIYILGEKFNISMEKEFFDYVKNDLEKLQKLTTPRELLAFFLEIKRKNFKNEKFLKKILEKLENS